jgi:hypothetical protein
MNELKQISTTYFPTYSFRPSLVRCTTSRGGTRVCTYKDTSAPTKITITQTVTPCSWETWGTDHEQVHVHITDGDKTIDKYSHLRQISEG